LFYITPRIYYDTAAVSATGKLQYYIITRKTRTMAAFVAGGMFILIIVVVVASSIIETNKNTMFRLKRSNVSFDSEYYKRQMQKLTENNQKMEECIDELKNRLNKLNTGELDQELIDEARRDTEEFKEKSASTRRRKIEEANKQKIKSERSQRYYQENHRAVKVNEREMEYAYRHFLRACNSVPNYMIRNLAEMPNNKGYIWKITFSTLTINI